MEYQTKENHSRTEFCTSKCIPSDYSNTNSLLISISNSSFFFFSILNCSIITSALDKKNFKYFQNEK